MRLIIILSCFLITGCVSKYLNFDVEAKARRHMVLAASKEDLSQFQDAIKEYILICDKYSDTSYYKPAVWKLTLLNINPDNPDYDYLIALEWLKIYSSLHLTQVEEETAHIYTILIQQTFQIQEEKEKLALEIMQQRNENAGLTNKLLQTRTNSSKKEKKLKKLSSCEAQLSIFKNKLANIEDKLRKMKEIDVQMHETRKNSSSTPE
ncbi:MAG: hypothetical protein PF690_12635 [Deltaproteobacteria bacterium]|nr:hypothetical protein [Deltaproteobacteria bacterium]